MKCVNYIEWCNHQCSQDLKQFSLPKYPCAPSGLSPPLKPEARQPLICFL